MVSKEHDLIITLHDTWTDKTNLYLLYEYCPKGELWNLLNPIVDKKTKKTKPKGLHLSFVHFYMAELIDILQYLHDKKILHRDLKPENIFIANDYHIRLGDFGTAKIIEEDIDPSIYKGFPKAKYYDDGNQTKNKKKKKKMNIQ